MFSAIKLNHCKTAKRNSSGNCCQPYNSHNDATTVINQLTFKEIIDAFAADKLSVAPSSQQGKEIEVVIVKGSNLEDSVANSALNAKKDLDANAYDQVSEAVGKATKTVDLSGSSQCRNMEVHFKPSITLENGITFGAEIEFEGDGAGVDRSNMMISSDSLGKITLGAHPSMGYGMMVAAPSVGLAINSGGHVHFIPVSAAGATYSTSNEVGPMRVSYQSPSLGGLTLGLSYAADGKGNGNSANHSGYLKAAETKGDLSDIFDLGVSFSQSLGETSFTLAARYGTAEQEGYSDKPKVAAVGAQIGFGGFMVGGGYADEKNPAGKDSDGWSLGASFKPDEAWKFGIETYQGEYDNGDDHSVAKIAASRNLGPDVAWDLYAITAESTTTQGSLAVSAKDPKPGDEGAAGTTLHSTGTTEGSGTIFGTAIRLNF